MKYIKSMKLTLAVVAALATLPLTGWSYAWSSTDNWATWANGGFWVCNDVWGSGAQTETIWANSYSYWGVTTSQSGGGIKSYPDVEKDINIAVNSLGTLSSSFSASTPGGSSYDLAYDIWLNGSSYEVMIWESWNATQPIASSYDANGNAIPQYYNQSIGGSSWNVYYRGGTLSFLRTSQTSSGSVDIKALLQWINTIGWYNNPTVAKVEFGWEILNTSGTQTFTMNSYSLNVSSGGGGGGGGCTPTAITPYVQVNGGTWNQTGSASVAAGGTVIIGPQPVSGGSWKWSGPNGFSSTSREITLGNIQSSQGGTYTATYTNPGGCNSTYSFSVTVSGGGGGGCTPTAITPYVQINGGAWSQTSNASLSAGGTLTFGPQPVSGGSWSWSGPSGFNSTARQVSVSNIQKSQAGTYAATYTNSGGCKSTQNFNVTVN